MVFVYTAMGVIFVEHANVLELCYIELLSGDGSPYSILSGSAICQGLFGLQERKGQGWCHVEAVEGCRVML